MGTAGSKIIFHRVPPHARWAVAPITGRPSLWPQAIYCLGAQGLTWLVRLAKMLIALAIRRNEAMSTLTRTTGPSATEWELRAN